MAKPELRIEVPSVLKLTPPFVEISKFTSPVANVTLTVAVRVAD